MRDEGMREERGESEEFFWNQWTHLTHLTHLTHIVRVLR